MASDPPADRSDGPLEELAEQEEMKQDEVLEREGVEQELMQDDRSEVGEQLDDVQDEVKGE